MEITAIEPGRALRWVVRQGAPEWAGTHVAWNLSPVDHGTRVRFSHRDFASVDGSFASGAFNWAWYLTSLNDRLETGQGRPGQLHA